MGYSKSITAVTRMESYLETLCNRNDRVVWLTEDSNKLCYKLHNAIYSAKYNGIKRFADLGSKWRIRALPNNQVEAVPIRMKEVIEEKPSEIIQFNDEISLLGIISLCLKNVSKTLHFGKPLLDADAESKLKIWAQANHMVITNKNGLTIGPYE